MSGGVTVLDRVAAEENNPTAGPRLHPKALFAQALLEAADKAATQHLPTARQLAFDALVQLNKLAFTFGIQPYPELHEHAYSLTGLPRNCPVCGGNIGTCFTLHDYLPSRLCWCCAEDAADQREAALAWQEGR